MKLLCFNGELLPDDQPIFTAQNRGFRYGDGVFETIKVYNGAIRLEQFHFERLYAALKLLHIKADAIIQKSIVKLILELCNSNGFIQSARVRLAVYRTEENESSFIIESMFLQKNINQLNEEGWVIDFYPYARKANDAFANLKTANYLPYVLADKYAKEKNLDESIVLNTENKICDASKANIFLVKKGEVFTPSLNQGCIAGVMRRSIIKELEKRKTSVHQMEITEQQLLDADEVFLTNAINDMRWVKKFRNKAYTNQFIQEFYKQTFSNIYS